MIGQKRFATLEWIIFLGLSTGAVAASEVIGMNQLWEDGVVYTVVLFTAILLTLRPAWGRESFWRNVMLIFAGHMVAVVVVVQELSPRRFGMPKLLLIQVAALEFVLIVGMLRKRKALRISGTGS